MRFAFMTQILMTFKLMGIAAESIFLGSIMYKEHIGNVYGKSYYV